jgi:hypothetical protein
MKLHPRYPWKGEKDLILAASVLEDGDPPALQSKQGITETNSSWRVAPLTKLGKRSRSRGTVDIQSFKRENFHFALCLTIAHAPSQSNSLPPSRVGSGYRWTREMEARVRN